MTITIITSEKQADFLMQFKSEGIKSVLVDKKEQEGFYGVEIEFHPFYDADLIAQVMFAAGITYGLDLQYSSYDNNIPR
jgi:hypothetical protein